MALDVKIVTDNLAQIIADQKARVGRFFTFQQKLLELKGRSAAIEQVNASEGTVLIARCDTLLKKQKDLESAGVDLIKKANDLYNNPLIQILTKNPSYTASPDISTDIIGRISAIFTDVKNALATSNVFNGEVSKQEDAIIKLEKDVYSKEKSILGQGIIPTLSKLGGGVTDILKWVAVAGVGVLGIYFAITSSAKAPRGGK